MTPEQIKDAEERAALVVNGFKRVNDRQAVDVLKLIGAISERDKVIEELKVLLTSNAKSMGETEPEFLKDIFSNFSNEKFKK